MPRRVYTYLPGLGWDDLNLFVSGSAFLLGVGVLLTVVNFVWSGVAGYRATDDPWGAPTLEWATESPPGPFAFRRVPVVRSAEPLWDAERAGETRAVEIDDPGDIRREVLLTSTMDALPDQRYELPGPSIWPFLVAFAIGVAFLGAVTHLAFVPIGGALAALAILGWHWPNRAAQRAGRARVVPEDEERRG